MIEDHDTDRAYEAGFRAGHALGQAAQVEEAGGWFALYLAAAFLFGVVAGGALVVAVVA